MSRHDRCFVVCASRSLRGAKKHRVVVVGVSSGVVYCALRYAGSVRVASGGSSTRAAHDLGTLHLRGPRPRAPPSRSASLRSRPGRSGAMSMPWSPRAMSGSCVSARLLAQARKRVSRGGFFVFVFVFVSTRRHRIRNRTRRSSRWEKILGSNVPRTAWTKWWKNLSPNSLISHLPSHPRDPHVAFDSRGRTAAAAAPTTGNRLARVCRGPGSGRDTCGAGDGRRGGGGLGLCLVFEFFL